MCAEGCYEVWGVRVFRERCDKVGGKGGGGGGSFRRCVT